MPGAILRKGSIVSAWKTKRASSPRALSALATASPTRISRRFPTWMWPEVLIPVTTTCGPGPSSSATRSAQPGTGSSLNLCSTYTSGSFSGLGRSGPAALARDLDVDDLVLRRAAGGCDGHLVPHLAPEDGAADGRGVGELAVRRVGLVGPDDLEGPLVLLAPAAGDPQRDAGAEVHGVCVGRGGVYHLRVPDAALYLPDPALQQALLGLGVVVLGVLRDVPELPCLPDAVGDLTATHLGEVAELLLELLEAFRGYEFLVSIGHWPRDYTGDPGGCQRETLLVSARRFAACQHASGFALASQHASALKGLAFSTSASLLWELPRRV